jgi:tRNA(Arg) A34 adenosine deaminase TadA
MDHEKYMREAIQLSLEAVRGNRGGPFGCVIVRDGRVIGRGSNHVTSDNDPTAHAEVTAIRDACRALGTFSLEGATLYTSCEPCPMCLSAIYWARIKEGYFGNTRQDAAVIGFDDDLIYREIPLPVAERQIPLQPLLPREASVAFAEWAAKADKVAY